MSGTGKSPGTINPLKDGKVAVRSCFFWITNSIDEYPLAMVPDAKFRVFGIGVFGHRIGDEKTTGNLMSYNEVLE
jgi:hypothetical protein